MASTTVATKIYPNNNVSSTKAAEIYREDNGRIYYVCFHCGFDSDNIGDILIHIDIHFSSRNDVQTDEHLNLVDIKFELDEDSHDVVDSTQLEQVFIDCGTKPLLIKEQCLQMDSSSVVVLPDQPALSLTADNFTDMEGLFEWKCLHCHCSFKKCAKLKQHLIKHKDDAVLREIHGTTNTEKIVMTRAHYSFKCTLCTSEFYDSISSEQHLQDSHAAPPPVKCRTCCEKFSTTEVLKEHMATVHTNAEKEATMIVLPAEPNQRKEIPADASDKNTLCTFCDKTFPGTLKLMQHIFGHFKLKIFSCLECPTKFQLMATFNKHMMKKHSLKRVYKFECRLCDDNVDHLNLFQFVSHVFTHHLDDGDRNNSDLDTAFNYHCRFCYEHFNKWNDARAHLEIHAKDELPRGLPSSALIKTDRRFTERSESGSYRSEFLYNCSSCISTLCGSYEARKHWYTEHGTAKHVTNKYCITEHKPSSNPVYYRILTAKETPAKGFFKCFDCDGSFKTLINLMRHRLMHFNIKPYSCTICSQGFGSISIVNQHMTMEHEGYQHLCGKLICKFCKAEFTEDTDFITHNFNVHLYENFIIDENFDELFKYECMYCSEITMERDLMDQHLQSHMDEVIPGKTNTGSCSDESSINMLRHNAQCMYICLRCPKKFRLPSVASNHAKLAHKVAKHEDSKKPETPNRDSHCNLCNITFLTWRSLINHRAKLHAETIVRRPETVKRKYNKNIGQAAKRKRRTPEGNHCNVCNATFLNNRSMINHRAKRHPETVQTRNRHPLYTCTFCGKTFGERSNFTKHIETHAKLCSYTCDICNKTYRLKNSLQTHMLIHTNEKNFVCEECGKNFYTTSKLNLHKQVHENLTFQCEKCDKKFYTRNNFSKHKKTHLDNVRKKCEVCGNTFKSAVSLRIHMLLHDDRKKYNCRYCQMTFAQSSGRRGHEKTRHGFV